MIATKGDTLYYADPGTAFSHVKVTKGTPESPGSITVVLLSGEEVTLDDPREAL